MDDKTYNLFNLVVNIFIAIGTIAVFIVAIWGEWLKNKLNPLKLKIVFPEKFGSLTKITGQEIKLIYYHLKVINERKNAIAKNCIVELVSISKKLPNGIYEKIYLPVPASFVWSPAGSNDENVTVNNYKTFDFLIIYENPQIIYPGFSKTPNNFEGFIKPNEPIRYELEIKADNFIPTINQTFEISWDGTFNESVEEMKRHLIIEEVLI
jgi:hypothetical protein